MATSRSSVVFSARQTTPHAALADTLGQAVVPQHVPGLESHASPPGWPS